MLLRSQNRLLHCLSAAGRIDQVMSLSKEYLVLNGVFYVILGLLFVYRNALQGIGSSMIAFFGGVLGTGYAFACCICACVCI